MDEAQGGPGQTVDAGRHPADAGRSPYRTTCRYFRREGQDGQLLAPFERADGANRCVAIGPPLEPSLRQQAMACLSLEHTECPRFVHAESTPREAVVRVEASRPQPRSRPEPSPEPAASLAPLGHAARRRSRATVAALLLLLASATTSFAFVLARGGLTMPAPVSSGLDGVAAATGTPVPTAVAAIATPEPTPSPTPRPTPAPSPTATPTATPAPTPDPTVKPTPTPRPRPTSERYAYLDPCPSTPNCWIYTIRSGDALYNLARYFGHPIETIYRLNPWTKTRGIHPGDKLILPPPTL